MSEVVVFLWLTNILLDTAGQLSFKAAAADGHAGELAGRWRHMLKCRWLWVGIICYVFEFVLWIAFLSMVPLGRGVLLGSINIVAIMLAGRYLFHERLGAWHYAGIGLVTVGVAIVGSGT